MSSLRRPRDICTAAFFGDIGRLQQLAKEQALGHRWYIEPPIDGDEAQQQQDSALLDDDAEADFTEEEVALIDADPQLKRIMEAYGPSPDAASEGQEPEDLDDEAAEEEEAEQLAQEAAIAAYRRLVRRRLHRDSIGRCFSTHGLITVGPAPPVDAQPYGMLCSCRDILTDRQMPSTDASPDDNHGAATALQLRWQPSKRSCFAGTPLHWAVVGRAADAVRFLVEHGADLSAGLQLVSSPSVTDPADSTLGCMDDAAQAVLKKSMAAVTAETVAVANASHATLYLLRTASLVYAAAVQADEVASSRLENEMEQRKQRRSNRAEERVRRREEEEAAAAAAAAAEEAEEDAEEFLGDDDVDGEAEEDAEEDGDNDG